MQKLRILRRLIKKTGITRVHVNPTYSQWVRQASTTCQKVVSGVRRCVWPSLNVPRDRLL